MGYKSISFNAYQTKEGLFFFFPALRAAGKALALLTRSHLGSPRGRVLHTRTPWLPARYPAQVCASPDQLFPGSREVIASAL